MFASKQLLPGVWQITDAMGVSMTLLTGSDRALLIDTGYGLEDVAAYVRTITRLPLTVILTHCHHDHALGARWFDETYMFAEDIAHFARYSSAEQRGRVLSQAATKGLKGPDDYLTSSYSSPSPLAEGTVDLGGMHAELIRCPGHTPGSCVVLIPERSLLLTADDWNPCTWVFFPEAMPLADYLHNMQALFARQDFTQVVCSHAAGLFDRARPMQLLQALEGNGPAAAYPVPLWPGEEIDPCRLDADEDLYIVFDRNKTEFKC